MSSNTPKSAAPEMVQISVTVKQANAIRSLINDKDSRQAARDIVSLSAIMRMEHEVFASPAVAWAYLDLFALLNE